MATFTIAIDPTSRRWVNKAGTLEILVFYDPANPGARYMAGPCANTILAEQSAIQAVITLRKGAGLDYPGNPAPSSIDTASVTV
mgnify:CR=1 FL=1